jgi:hypothetical protein
MKLQPLIEQYVAFRRVLGARFHSTAEILGAFVRALGPETEAGAVTATQIAAFLTGAGDTPASSATPGRRAAMTDGDRLGPWVRRFLLARAGGEAQVRGGDAQPAPGGDPLPGRLRRPTQP